MKKQSIEDSIRERLTHPLIDLFREIDEISKDFGVPTGENGPLDSNFTYKLESEITAALMRVINSPSTLPQS